MLNISGNLKGKGKASKAGFCFGCLIFTLWAVHGAPMNKTGVEEIRGFG